MISGTATLITVASARVRKMPGARARTTSQGLKARRACEASSLLILSLGRGSGSGGRASSIPAVYPSDGRGEGVCHSGVGAFDGTFDGSVDGAIEGAIEGSHP